MNLSADTTQRHGPVKSVSIGPLVLFLTMLTLLGQLLALARESAIAAKFGTSSLTDAFLLAMMIPNALLLFIQNGLMMSFVPVFAETLTVGGEERAWQLGSSVINGIVLMTGLLGALAFILADPIIGIIAPSLSLADHSLTVQMLRLLLSVGVLGGSMALLSGILNVYRVFTVPSLFGLVLNCTTVIGLLLLTDTLSIYALVAATIGAYLLYGLLLLIALRNVQRYRLILQKGDPALHKLVRLAWPALLTLLLQQVIVVVDRMVAVRLGVGSVAALNFSSKLVWFVQTLLIGALSTVVLPEISRMLAGGDWQRARAAALSVLRYTVFASIPVAIMLFMLQRPLTSLAFERGAFDAGASDLTASATGFYALGITAMSLREIVVRLLYAAHDMHSPLLSGALRMLVNLALDIVLSLTLGINGIALAYAIAVSIDVVVMVTVWARRWHISFNPTYLMKLLAAGTVCMLVVVVVAPLSGDASADSHWLHHARIVLTVVSAGGLVYWGACWLFNVSESKAILGFGLSQLKSVQGRLFGEL